MLGYPNFEDKLSYAGTRLCKHIKVSMSSFGGIGIENDIFGGADGLWHSQHTTPQKEGGREKNVIMEGKVVIFSKHGAKR